MSSLDKLNSLLQDYQDTAENIFQLIWQQQISQGLDFVFKFKSVQVNEEGIGFNDSLRVRGQESGLTNFFHQVGVMDAGVELVTHQEQTIQLWIINPQKISEDFDFRANLNVPFLVENQAYQITIKCGSQIFKFTKKADYPWPVMLAEIDFNSCLQNTNAKQIWVNFQLIPDHKTDQIYQELISLGNLHSTIYFQDLENKLQSLWHKLPYQLLLKRLQLWGHDSRGLKKQSAIKLSEKCFLSSITKNVYQAEILVKMLTARNWTNENLQEVVIPAYYLLHEQNLKKQRPYVFTYMRSFLRSDEGFFLLYPKN